jgi:hypothetical protein
MLKTCKIKLNLLLVQTISIVQVLNTVFCEKDGMNYYLQGGDFIIFKLFFHEPTAKKL